MDRWKFDGIGRRVNFGRNLGALFMTQPQAGSARFVRYEPNSVELTADSQGGGVLVLTDAYDQNWDVRVDGAPATLLRVDTALRGVCVSPGPHRVTFDYNPRLFFAGLIISVLGWVLTGGLLLWRR